MWDIFYYCICLLCIPTTFEGTVFFDKSCPILARLDLPLKYLNRQYNLWTESEIDCWEIKELTLYLWDVLVITILVYCPINAYFIASNIKISEVRNKITKHLLLVRQQSHVKKFSTIPHFARLAFNCDATRKFLNKIRNTHT